MGEKEGGSEDYFDLRPCVLVVVCSMSELRHRLSKLPLHLRRDQEGAALQFFPCSLAELRFLGPFCRCNLEFFPLFELGRGVVHTPAGDCDLLIYLGEVCTAVRWNTHCSIHISPHFVLRWMISVCLFIFFAVKGDEQLLRSFSHRQQKLSTDCALGAMHQRYSCSCGKGYKSQQQQEYRPLCIDLARRLRGSLFDTPVRTGRECIKWSEELGSADNKPQKGVRARSRCPYPRASCPRLP